MQRTWGIWVTAAALAFFWEEAAYPHGEPPVVEGRQVTTEPTLPKLAVRPKRSPKCIHADLFEINWLTVSNPQDDKPIAKAISALELKVDKVAHSVEETVSKGHVFHDANLDTIVVSFRGSLPPDEKPNDWVCNVAAVPKPMDFYKKNREKAGCLVHWGFYDMAQEYKKLLVQVRALQIDAKKKNGRAPKVYVTGYSLGGALATFFAQMLAEDRNPPDELVLFGSPKVGTIHFGEIFYTHSISATHYRVAGDPVPYLPPLAGKLPARDYELYAPEVTGANPIDTIVKQFKELHVCSSYGKRLQKLCEEDDETKKRELYDYFLKETKRTPTEKEFDRYVTTMLRDGSEKAKKNIAQFEKDLRKEIGKGVQFYMERAATEDELKLYTTIAADKPDLGPVDKILRAKSPLFNPKQ